MHSERTANRMTRLTFLQYLGLYLVRREHYVLHQSKLSLLCQLLTHMSVIPSASVSAGPNTANQDQESHFNLREDRVNTYSLERC